MTALVTRLAPSPTGTLHLGNARTFLINWALARNRGWKIILRIEDLDSSRVRPSAATQTIDILNWLGVDFDDGPHVQSHDLEPYRRAMRKLGDLNMIYACRLTRREIAQAASAPHAGDRELRFPPQLRPRHAAQHQFNDELSNYRFRVNEEWIEIHDEIAGVGRYCPSQEVGDFVVWTKSGVPAYQLAVVVDDARQGVTEVVRGDDLLPSAARQTLIYRALELPTPRWWHVPLVLGEGGRRLAKRDATCHLDSYRCAGVRAQRVIGLLAHWCGACDRPNEMAAEDFRRSFALATLPRSPVVFTQEHHAWLFQGC
jgi:glutamyl-tRNA synthetase